jgi:hypothetical protein
LELQPSNGPKWAKEYAVTKTKTDRADVPVDEQVDPEVISFRAQFDQRSPLDEIVKEGARRMLQTAIDAEVEAFIAMHADRTDERGRRLVVKNGSLPEREILTGAGAIPVTQGRVRDNDPDTQQSRHVLPECAAKLPAKDQGDRRTHPMAVPQRHFDG